MNTSMVYTDLQAFHLKIAMQNLDRQWAQIKVGWRDRISDLVERQYLQPLSDELRSTIRAMEILSEILESAKRKVSPVWTEVRFR